MGKLSGQLKNEKGPVGELSQESPIHMKAERMLNEKEKSLLVEKLVRIQETINQSEVSSENFDDIIKCLTKLNDLVGN